MTPKCIRPFASSFGISPADKSTSSTPSTPVILPVYSLSEPVRLRNSPLFSNHDIVSF